MAVMRPGEPVAALLRLQVHFYKGRPASDPECPSVRVATGEAMGGFLKREHDFMCTAVPRSAWSLAPHCREDLGGGLLGEGGHRRAFSVVSEGGGPAGALWPLTALPPPPSSRPRPRMTGAQVSERGGWGSLGGGAGPRPIATGFPPEGKAHREHREKLELVASFSFFGNVMSMASVQLAGAKRDALLLSFKDAKVGVGAGGWAGHHSWGALVLTCHPPPAVGGGVRPGHPRPEDPVPALL